MAKAIDTARSKDTLQRFGVFLRCESAGSCGRLIELDEADVFGTKIVRTHPTVKWVKRAAFTCPSCKKTTYLDYDSLPQKLKNRVDAEYIDSTLGVKK